MVLVSAALAAPNFLVIVADDVGVDKVGIYAEDVLGYPEAANFLPSTPTVDALASAGLRFTAAWSNPVCSPTRAGLLTGRHAFRTGVGYTVPEGPALDPSTEITLAGLLEDPTTGEPYATGVFGKWHLGDAPSPPGPWSLADDEDGYLEIAATAHPLRTGFSWYEGGILGAIEDYHDWTKTTAVDPALGILAVETTHPTTTTVEDALAWIGDQSQPWFAVVSFNAAHTDGRTGTYTFDQIDPGCHTVTCLDDHTCRTSERAIYQAHVECLDTAVGDLLVGLAPDVLDETLIVFLSDNGSPSTMIEGTFANAGGRTSNGKGTPYQTGVNVPLVVAQGRNYREYTACTDAEREGGLCRLSSDLVRFPGRIIRAGVHTTDLYATFLEAGGRTNELGEDSLSLAGCLTATTSRCNNAATSPSRALYTEQFLYEIDEVRGQVLSVGAAALRRGTQKLVATYVPSGACLRYELYDLSTDSLERTNLVTTNPSALRTLSALLAGVGAPWMSGLGGCPPA